MNLPAQGRAPPPQVAEAEGKNRAFALCRASLAQEARIQRLDQISAARKS